MSEQAQTVDENMSEGHYEENFDFGEQLIALLGGIVIGGIVFGIFSALVAIVRVSEPPGWTVTQLLDILKLVPPPGVNLSGLPTIVLYPAENETINWVLELILLNISWVMGLVGLVWGYNKVLSLPDANE